MLGLVPRLSGCARLALSTVMAGRRPGHPRRHAMRGYRPEKADFPSRNTLARRFSATTTWMAGSSPAMTREEMAVACLRRVKPLLSHSSVPLYDPLVLSWGMLKRGHR